MRMAAWDEHVVHSYKRVPVLYRPSVNEIPSDKLNLSTQTQDVTNDGVLGNVDNVGNVGNVGKWAVGNV